MKSRWESMGWSTQDYSVGGYSITRYSSYMCGRCGHAGPWLLRALPNEELAHRDYAVCRCGELVHAETVWPGSARPTQS